VSTTMWLIGQPATIEIVDSEAGPTELDRLRVRFGYQEPDPSAVIEIDRISASRTHTVQIATGSGATYVWRDGDLLVERPGRGDERLVTAGEEPLVREVGSFLESVRTGEEARSDGRFGARVVDVVERIGQLLQPVNGPPLRAGVSE